MVAGGGGVDDELKAFGAIGRRPQPAILRTHIDAGGRRQPAFAEDLLEFQGIIIGKEHIVAI